MIRLAPLALLILAIIVPLCTGTIWGNLLLLGIVSGIFFGTVSLGAPKPAKDLGVLPDKS